MRHNLNPKPWTLNPKPGWTQYSQSKSKAGRYVIPSIQEGGKPASPSDKLLADGLQLLPVMVVSPKGIEQAMGSKDDLPEKPTHVLSPANGDVSWRIFTSARLTVPAGHFMAVSNVAFMAPEEQDPVED